MTLDRRVAGRWMGVAIAVGLAGVSGTPTRTLAAVRVKQELTATSMAPGASGRAKLALKRAGKGKFSISGRRLAAHQSFDVIVGGVKVATMVTSGGGNGRVRLSTKPRGRVGLLGFDPRGEQVEVRDEDGEDHLVGDMPDEEDANAVACCLPHHEGDEVECEDESPDECMAAGGEPAHADSCIPNPCGTAPPGGGEVTCCIRDSAEGAFTEEDPEVECERTSEHECAEEGGMVVQVDSCEPDPCAPAPPAHTVVCCVPEDEETECEVLTAERCTAEHGTVSDATSCDTHPCGGGDDGGGDDSGHDGGDH